MNPILVAGPAVEAVSLVDLKAHLRLDGTDEDGPLLGLLVAARRCLEAATRLAFVAQTWRLHLDAWPPQGRLALPVAPVLAVAAIRVNPASGPAVTVAPDTYGLDAARDPAALVLDGTVPAPGLPRGGIEIDLSCGFGPEAASVPAPLGLAIKLLAARWYSHRGDGDGLLGEGLPPDVRSLIAPFVRPRLA
ncbi:MAG: uncharacterized protein JWR08_1979 [Enterovirga sp.]|jgi:uncharacterized phiE125 gp8 family phage protein|nr:uncharacterized protein [Enterovirga sp.]